MSFPMGVRILVAAVLCAAPTFAAQAAIVQTNAFNNTVAGLPVSNTDLFQTNLASVSGTSISSFGGGTVAVLADGLLGNVGAVFAPDNVAPGNGATITFALDTATNPLGYQISSLATIASWDTGRDGQSYVVAFSTVSAPTVFTDLFTLTPYQSPQANFNPATTSVTLTQDAGDGLLATNVAAIRYTFDTFENSGTAYREFDAVGAPVGAATVPEPTTALLLGMPLLGWLAARRRNAK
ncbi:MAG: PEP-CTERM sorting domain-containing protein [Armatimonadetes bacterium]|nr:PEP-CTERM sorting domain-containing protein [Armatimonadota bacterium]